MEKQTTRKTKMIIPAIIIFIVSGIAYAMLTHFRLIPKISYTAEDFGITTVKSRIDFNHNGIDDYTDILLGARKDAQNKPKYDGKYWAGGYPPDDIGVCTDVVWRAFKNAGYSLKDMVDHDIKEHIEDYPRVGGKRDSNIDFRRVPNLRVFFTKYGISLTLDPKEIDQWQPGDIVTYANTHIAIVSDKRNKDGIPFIIHNSGQPLREEDALVLSTEISGHFRFDASKVDKSVLVPFE